MEILSSRADWLNELPRGAVGAACWLLVLDLCVCGISASGLRAVSQGRAVLWCKEWPCCGFTKDLTFCLCFSVLFPSVWEQMVGEGLKGTEEILSQLPLNLLSSFHQMDSKFFSLPNPMGCSKPSRASPTPWCKPLHEAKILPGGFFSPLEEI